MSISALVAKVSNVSPSQETVLWTDFILEAARPRELSLNLEEPWREAFSMIS